ncbi:MAG: hypothetical protein EOM87_03640 [Clostridia bacterium]|nr:hypothetical protein [Clostridia bacterium]
MQEKQGYDYSQHYYGRYKKLFRSGYFENSFESYPDNAADNIVDASSPNFNETPHTIIDMRQNSSAKVKVRRSKGKSFVLTVCVLVMCVSILFLSVDFFSSKGIVGELKSVFTFTNDDCVNYYAVNMGTFNTLTEARQLSEAIRVKGAAGYITHSGAYNVLAACYISYNDAKAIADSNAATVFTIRVFKKSRKDFPAKLRDSFDNTVGYEKSVYDTLYSLSNQLDEGDITENECIQSIVELKGRIKAKTDGFMEQSAANSDNFTLEYRVKIIACLAALDNLTNTVLLRPNLLSDVRYTYLMVLNMA